MAGALGRDGIDGAPGRDDVDGVDGAPGAPGRDGVDGVDGAPGALGRDDVDGLDGSPGASWRDGVSPDAPRWVATLAYSSNTHTDVGFEVENLGESGSIWTNIASFPLPIKATIPKTALAKYEL